MLMRSPVIRNKERPTTERAYRSQIFIDKVVDPRKEPTLFNIESARMSIAAKTGPHTHRARDARRFERNHKREGRDRKRHTS